MSAQAQVVEIRRPERAFMPCRCFEDSVPDPGRMMWLRWPNANQGTIRLCELDARRIVKRGYCYVRGVHALTSWDDPQCRHDVVLDFQGLWTEPHP